MRARIKNRFHPSPGKIGFWDDFAFPEMDYGWDSFEIPAYDFEIPEFDYEIPAYDFDFEIPEYDFDFEIPAYEFDYPEFEFPEFEAPEFEFPEYEFSFPDYDDYPVASTQPEFNPWESDDADLGVTMQQGGIEGGIYTPENPFRIPGLPTSGGSSSGGARMPAPTAPRLPPDSGSGGGGITDLLKTAWQIFTGTQSRTPQYYPNSTLPVRYYPGTNTPIPYAQARANPATGGGIYPGAGGSSQKTAVQKAVEFAQKNALPLALAGGGLLLLAASKNGKRQRYTVKGTQK